MKSFFLLTAAAALLRTASAAERPDVKSFPAEAVKSISVRTDGGPITLDTSNDKTLSASVSPVSAPTDRCVISRVLRDGKLTLSAISAPKALHGPAKSCSAGFSASAPPNVGLTVRSGSGSVELGPFAGKIDVRTDSGAIMIHGASGPLILRTSSGGVTGRAGGGQDIVVESGSGNVYLRGLSGSIKARSGTGIVALAWTAAPPVGDIDVRTVGGDFIAMLPRETELKFSLKSRSGKVRSDFGSDASASLVLTFRSESGYATLRKRSSAEGMKEDFGPTEVFDREDLLRW